MEKIYLYKDQRLYVLNYGKYVSCLGFDVCLERATALNREMETNIRLSKPGTLKLYRQYEQLIEVARRRNRETGWKSNSELIPHLIGLEGKRVEVTYDYGKKERFYVGRSSGFIPCHLAIKRKDAIGGAAVCGDIVNVRILY